MKVTFLIVREFVLKIPITILLKKLHFKKFKDLDFLFKKNFKFFANIVCMRQMSIYFQLFF